RSTKVAGSDLEKRQAAHSLPKTTAGVTCQGWPSFGAAAFATPPDASPGRRRRASTILFFLQVLIDPLSFTTMHQNCAAGARKAAIIFFAAQRISGIFGRPNQGSSTITTILHFLAITLSVAKLRMILQGREER